MANVHKYPSNIASVVSREFKISRQAAHKHLFRLVSEKALATASETRYRTYTLVPEFEALLTYKIDENLAEDTVWRIDIQESLSALPSNVANIWHYAFTEMFNNAIDHSEGSQIWVLISRTAAFTEIKISDNGIGIFKKIQTRLKLLDERQAVLELSKGKLTTDPAKHTGEGIFFSSRMFDAFQILSGETYFSHQAEDDRDWILQSTKPEEHTTVFMKLNNHTSRTTKKIFQRFTTGDDPAFTKTVVPVRLAQYGHESLISRSQAKRLLARVDRFKTVLFDFEGVDMIGQAFADEIFRVFANQHPEVELVPIRFNSEVAQMISRARSNS